MSKVFKFSRDLLEKLVVLRMKLAEKSYREFGVGGLLLEDKQGIVSGCCLISKASCCPSPYASSKDFLNGVIKSCKKGYKVVGYIVLNPDQGEQGEGDEDDFYIGHGGGYGYKEIPYYTLYRNARSLRDYKFPVLVMTIIPSNVPLSITIESEKELDYINKKPGAINSYSPEKVLKVLGDKRFKCVSEEDMVYGVQGELMTIKPQLSSYIKKEVKPDESVLREKPVEVAVQDKP